MKDFSSRTQVVIPLEWHLLLAFARLRPSVGDRRIFETVASHTGIDWDRLFQLACQNDVAPLVYHGIRETGASHVTPAVRTKLSAAYAANAMRNAILFEELGNRPTLPQKQTDKDHRVEGCGTC